MRACRLSEMFDFGNSCVPDLYTRKPVTIHSYTDASGIITNGRAGRLFLEAMVIL